MDKILFINACVRQNSRTKILADYLLSKLSGNVEEVCLQTEGIQPLDGKLLAKRDELIKSQRLNDAMLKYANQFANADVIVIAAPYWDLGFPSLLKIYLEAITVSGITFSYDGNGVPQSKCKAKKLFYVTTCGGQMFVDFGYSYVKSLANNFFGIKDTTLFDAQNLDVIGVDVDAQLNKTKENIDKML